jgi:hypothetical protein
VHGARGHLGAAGIQDDEGQGTGICRQRDAHRIMEGVGVYARHPRRGGFLDPPGALKATRARLLRSCPSYLVNTPPTSSRWLATGRKKRTRGYTSWPVPM